MIVTIIAASRLRCPNYLFATFAFLRNSRIMSVWFQYVDWSSSYGNFKLGSPNKFWLPDGNKRPLALLDWRTTPILVFSDIVRSIDCNFVRLTKGMKDPPWFAAEVDLCCYAILIFGGIAHLLNVSLHSRQWKSWSPPATFCRCLLRPCVLTPRIREPVIRISR